MISATTFSRGYSSFWQEVTPWLNSYVVHINKVELIRCGKPLDNLDDEEHRAINNLVAFIQFQLERERIVTPGNYSMALSKAISILRYISKKTIKSYDLTKINKLIITNQLNNLKKTYPAKCEFNPRFSGFSLVLESEADMIIGKKLIEIKAADRKVSSGDIKQIITYIILNHLSNIPRKITDIELYNPRHGKKYAISIDDLLSNISTLKLPEICYYFDFYIENIGTRSM